MNASRKLAALGAAFAVAALAVALVAAPATATRTVRIPSKISIHSKSLKFSGKVTAGKYEPCVQQRKVILFRVFSDGSNQAVGETRTDDAGRWTITPQGSAGISMSRFFARVKKESQGTAGTIYVCRAARSKTIKPTT
ncbi:MAG: hypothetical protein U0R71_04165 [Solirubrobacterales bacterium]